MSVSKLPPSSTMYSRTLTMAHHMLLTKPLLRKRIISPKRWHCLHGTMKMYVWMGRSFPSLFLFFEYSMFPRFLFYFHIISLSNQLTSRSCLFSLTMPRFGISYNTISVWHIICLALCSDSIAGWLAGGGLRALVHWLPVSVSYPNAHTLHGQFINISYASTQHILGPASLHHQPWQTLAVAMDTSAWI